MVVKPPFGARGLPLGTLLTQCPAVQRMMRANHGAVDHLQGVRNDPALGQRLQDLFPEADECPTPDLPIGTRPFPELFRKVPPRRAGTCYPENAIKNKAVVGGFASIWGANGKNELFKDRPLLIRHQESCQAGLHRRYQLELYSKPDVNPFWQHGLGSSVNSAHVGDTEFQNWQRRHVRYLSGQHIHGLYT